MPFADHFCEVDGRRVGYVDQGEGGVPLVLLHGAGFDHAELTWRLTFPILAKTRRVIVPDLPGYGESEGFDGPYDLADLTRWLIAFLDEIGVEQCDISGVSMGGGAALRLALDAPEKVRKLVPVCAYGLMDKAPFHELAWAVSRSPAAGLIYQAAAASPFLTRIGLGASYADPARVTPDTIAAVQDVARDQGQRRSADAFFAREITPTELTGSLIRRLPEIRQPTLFIHGTRDRIVPVRHAKEAVTLVPNSRLHLMETGHWPMREQPEAFTERLIRFLDGEDGDD
ncbi:alpha/beta fold hydrolase [Aestuariibius insulae]|uniref:alpha/beta fold hydrolase n=1 Tax=Aestuariibius insulae TaxID=2058287 RepID=UPI00345E2F29